MNIIEYNDIYIYVIYIILYKYNKISINYLK